MKFEYSSRGTKVTVYTSERKPLEVEPGDVVDTEDEKLIARLQADPLFSEVKPKSLEKESEVEPDIEEFVIEPKVKVKRKKRK